MRIRISPKGFVRIAGGSDDRSEGEMERSGKRAGAFRTARNVSAMRLVVDRRWSPEDAMSEIGDPGTRDATERIVDVRDVAPPERHPRIFGTFTHLAPGESFVLVNDHDPKPLYYQFQAELAGQFSWEYLELGPTTWRVRIGKEPASTEPRRFPRVR